MGTAKQWEDPIVAETHAARQELIEEVGNDVDALFGYLMQREGSHPDKVVDLPPRRVPATAANRTP
ncbi:MAG TPA: hypothetical protein VMT00_09020 [Thermoanaerobaculia bacterium]|nr:hypothetical protein [Thermoanaerobaculia bacterium]